MFDVHPLCYPWDVSEARADAVLDRMPGEISATGLTVIAATRLVCQLRRRPGAVQPPWRGRHAGDLQNLAAYRSPPTLYG